MKRFIRMAGLALVGASFLLSAPAQADDQCCDDCNWWCGDFQFGIDALLWKPQHCTFQFAVETSATTIPSDALETRTVHAIKGDFDWGVRIHAAYARRCSFVGLSYLYIDDNRSSEVRPMVSGNTLAPVNLTEFISDATNVRGRLKQEYQNVDARFGQFITRQCGCEVYTWVNFRYVDLERNENTFATLVDTVPQCAEYEQKSKFDGAGLGVGIGGNFHICNGFYFWGELNPVAIIGDRRTPTAFQRHDLGTGTPQVVTREFDFPRATCIVPGLDFRFAINYAVCCDCVTAVLELGYETNYYWGALEYNVGTTDANDVPETRTCQDFGFAGPYFGVTLQF